MIFYEPHHGLMSVPSRGLILMSEAQALSQTHSNVNVYAEESTAKKKKIPTSRFLLLSKY